LLTDFVFDSLIANIFFQSLYESSIAFGMRKALNSEHERHSRSKLVSQLQSENRALEKEVFDLEKKIVQFELSESEKRQMDEKKHEKVII
jgi:dynein light intermediate chain